MVYEVLAAVIALLAVVLLLLALRSLLRGGWLLGWLKGTLGFAVIALALIFALGAWDLSGYKAILSEKPLATISFKQIGDRRYLAVLIVAEGQNEQKFELRGDQWQLDARILKWHDSLLRLGLKPGYRLSRLAGRYYLLDDERNAPRSVFDLYSSAGGVDVWSWFNRVDSEVPWLDAIYGNATFAPMSDGALYEVRLSASGLVSRPLNDSAREAVKRWL